MAWLGSALLCARVAHRVLAVAVSHLAVSRARGVSSVVIKKGHGTDDRPFITTALFAKMAVGADTEGIKVAVRVRPFLPHEAGSSSCVEVDGDANQISIGRSDRSSLESSRKGGGASSATAAKPRKTFTFDHALAGNTPQNDVYDSCVSTLIANCLEGFNATTLACKF